MQPIAASVCDLGVLQLAGPHHLEAGALDLLDDLAEAEALEVVGVEHRCGEQEVEALEIVHCRSRICWRYSSRHIR